jgi:hypothetical protein
MLMYQYGQTVITADLGVVVDDYVQHMPNR